MRIFKKLLGATAMLGLIALSAGSLSGEPDPGKNFTVSDSPETTVFNLQVPSNNRHIINARANPQPEPMAAPAPAPVATGDCAPRVMRESVERYLVRLEKTAPDLVALNTPFDYGYTVVVKEDVSTVVVEDSIPAGAIYVSSSPEAEVIGDSVVWTLYNLKKGDRIPLSLTVQAVQIADLSNCATITAFPEACTVTSVGVPELAIIKTTPNEQVMLGSNVPWNIIVTNVGNFCAYDVVVTDRLPMGVAHRSGQEILVSEIGTLSPGESREITIDTQAVRIGEHCNVAMAEASNAAPVQDDACIVVVEAGLEVVKDGTPLQFLGKRASYVITATNTGDLPLTDVVITDTVPRQNRLLSAPGASINGNTAVWNTRLSPGQSKSFELTVLGLETGVYCNQVSAESAQYGLRRSDDACTEWRGYPALLIEVIDTEDPLLIGEETTYVVQITNQGTARDTNVTLDVALPANLEIVTATGATQGAITGQMISFAPYTVLEAKEIIEYRIRARAIAEGDSRFKADMDSDLLRSPVPEVEATQVY